MKGPIMWFPCFHHILETVVGSFIQHRWKTGGPRDAIYTRFRNEWPRLLEKMPEITSNAHEIVRSNGFERYLIDSVASFYLESLTSWRWPLSHRRTIWLDECSHAFSISSPELVKENICREAITRNFCASFRWIRMMAAIMNNASNEMWISITLLPMQAISNHEGIILSSLGRRYKVELQISFLD